jgi:predicted transcriptional regulator
MELKEIKKKLHSNIDLIEDEAELQLLAEAAEAYASKQSDLLDFLDEEQLQRLNESIKQANAGNLVNHEDVMKLSKQWLTK